MVLCEITCNVVGRSRSLKVDDLVLNANQKPINKLLSYLARFQIDRAEWKFFSVWVM